MPPLGTRPLVQRVLGHLLPRALRMVEHHALLHRRLHRRARRKPPSLLSPLSISISIPIPLPPCKCNGFAEHTSPQGIYPTLIIVLVALDKSEIAKHTLAWSIPVPGSVSHPAPISYPARDTDIDSETLPPPTEMSEVVSGSGAELLPFNSSRSSSSSLRPSPLPTASRDSGSPP